MTIVAGQMMKAGFDSSDILQIAGRLEDNAIAFYTEQAGLSCDTAVSNACCEMVDWWETHRHRLSERMGLQVSQSPALSHPFEDAPFDSRAMADLAVFSLNHCRNGGRILFKAVEDVLNDAIERCQEVELFFEGLKRFAYDQAADLLLDELAAMARRRHIMLSAILGEKRAVRTRFRGGRGRLNSWNNGI